MRPNRPKNLYFTSLKLPVMGVASILHRVSAVIIWIAMFFFLPLLYISLESKGGFNDIKTIMAENIFAQFFCGGS